MRLFLLTVGSFLLTVELYYLQSTIIGFFTYRWSFFAYNFSLLALQLGFFLLLEWESSNTGMSESKSQLAHSHGSQCWPEVQHTTLAACERQAVLDHEAVELEELRRQSFHTPSQASNSSHATQQ